MQKIFPRVIIAATQSGAGKTTITSGILAALKKRGLNVQPYKVGPDYIDTGFHEIASGKVSHNLDSWLVGEKKLFESFFMPLERSRIAVIEGVMGLYDCGVGGVSSTAEISLILRSPVILVIDAKSMGTSAAAVALGFREFDKNVNLAGVILNRVGSDSHKKIIVDALEKINIKCFGAIKRNAEFVLPERHLGLVPTAENNFAGIIEKICATVESELDIDKIIEVANSAPAVNIEIPAVKKISSKCFGAIKRNAEFVLPERHLGLVPTAENNFAGIIEKICATVESELDIDKIIEVANSAPPVQIQNYSTITLPHYHTKIAVAKDAAFNFYYEESLQELEKLGAEIVYFSPLDDEKLPENISGLIIGGGFPEMFAEKLQSNKKIRAAIRTAAENNLPIYAECGGFMYLMNTITDFGGRNFEMCGVIPARAFMTDKLQMVGYVEAEILQDCIIGKAGDKLHAHEFHFSTAETDRNIFACKRIRTGKIFRAGFFTENIVASYLHIHFAGCPRAAENFVNACNNYNSFSGIV
ncbi:MAG: cobyrinate a,c-diamide synthase [Selenomonadaceae bacterium]|nr:cobyrinate a,c-diamide synthase [Selenomonadaceae bacterium]